MRFLRFLRFSKFGDLEDFKILQDLRGLKRFSDFLLNFPKSSSVRKKEGRLSFLDFRTRFSSEIFRKFRLFEDFLAFFKKLYEMFWAICPCRLIPARVMWNISICDFPISRFLLVHFPSRSHAASKHHLWWLWWINQINQIKSTTNFALLVETRKKPLKHFEVHQKLVWS